MKRNRDKEKRKNASPKKKPKKSVKKLRKPNVSLMKRGVRLKKPKRNFELPENKRKRSLASENLKKSPHENVLRQKLLLRKLNKKD